VITATAYRSACRPSRGGAAADPQTQAPAERHTGPQPAGSGSALAPTGCAAGGVQQAQPVGGAESMSSLRTVRPFSWCAWRVHGSGRGSDTSPETFRLFAWSPPRAGRVRRRRRRRAAPISAATISTPRPVHLQTLADDSWLAQVRSATDKKADPITVRVIDYTLDDGRDNPERYRLFTTILDPTVASATELAAAYVQRWEIELAFDELKTHQRGPRTVLRSKSPTLVLQEIWGHLCCHYAIRSLMTDAATHSGHDPDRVSFVAALAFLTRLLRRLNPARRLRAAPRVIKRKMPRWHVKRAHHADWPQPQHSAGYTTQRPN